MMKIASKFTIFTLMLVLMTAASATAEGYKPVAASDKQETVYIHKVEVRDGHTYLEVDPIQWYEGEEANKVFLEREGSTDMPDAPDGYYIINDSVQNDVYQVAPEAKVEVQIYDHTGRIEDVQVNWNESVSLASFAKEFGKIDVLDLSQFPYHVTIQNGQIVKIVQQFIP